MRKYFMILAVAGVSLLFLSQFQVADRFYGGIDTSNYFTLLLGTMVATVGLVKIPRTLYWGDVVAFCCSFTFWYIRGRLRLCRVGNFI